MAIDPSIAMGYRGLGELPNPMNQLAQVSQIQQSMRQGQMAELQFKKAQDTEAKLNQWYTNIAKNGGPTDRIEIENQMIRSDIQPIVDMGLKARMTRLGLEEDRKRDYEAMFGPQPLGAAPGATSAAQPAAMPAQAPVPAQVNNLAPEGTAPAQAVEPVNNLLPATAPAAPATSNNLDLERSARLKMLSKNPGVVAAGRIELQQLMTPRTQTVDGQVVERGPDGTYRVVFGNKKELPIIELQNILAAMPLDDPRRPALQAEVNKAKTAEEQGAERIKIQWRTLSVGQQNLAVNQASLKLRQDAPKNGLTDPDDIERVALAVASGRIPVDRLNSGTAKIYAGLLKTNPNLDLTALSIEQAGDKTRAVTSARIEIRQTLTDVDATQAENIAKGNLPPATGPNAGKIMNAVIAINPEYNARDYGLQTAAEKEFSTGKNGNKTRSLNVAVSHLTTLDTAATALRAGSIPALNQFSQAWQRETGKIGPTSFNAIRELVADEIVAAVVPGVGALADRKALKDTIMAKSSPEQLQGVIKQYKELLGGQLGGLEKQYNASTRKTDFRQRYLTPEAVAALTTGQTAPPAGAAPTATSPPPAGVDAALWNVMTPDERKLWQK
jgi:hypothetical protein